MMKNSNCSDNSTNSTSETATIIIASAGTCSLLFCTLAVVILIALRLYKHLVYRLAMYQMIGAWLQGLSVCLAFMRYGYRSSLLYYRVSCKFIAFFLQCCVWVKLVFTNWLTFHLFCYIIFFKNFKRLEWLYITSSFVVPLLFNWIPFIHNNYGMSGPFCFIRSSREVGCETVKYVEGIVEVYVLFYGPAVIFLTLDLMAIIMMFAVLLQRVYKKSNVDVTSQNECHLQVMKQLLPLSAYPIIDFVLYLLQFGHRVYSTVSGNTFNRDLYYAQSVLYGLSGFFAALALMVHIGTIKCKKKPTRTPAPLQSCDIDYATFAGVTPYTSGAVTKFSLLRESDVDD